MAIPPVATALPSAPQPFRLSRISSVGIVVQDVKKAARAWSDVFEVTAHEGRVEGASRVVRVPLDNLVVELVEPAATGPAREFLQRHGEGIEYISVENADLAQTAHALVSQGGRLVSLRRRAAHVDFDAQMGGAIQLRRMSHLSGNPAMTAGPRPDHTVRAIGHLTRDVEQSRRFWAGVFGLTVPLARDTKGVPFPNDCDCDREAYIREVNIRLDNLGINLIQPVGGKSVWRRMIERHEGLDYLQFSVAGQQGLDDRVSAFEKKGGIRTLGAPGAPYAYIDFQDQLGITLLLVKSAS
jgi:hypothetical protein